MGKIYFCDKGRVEEPDPAIPYAIYVTPAGFTCSCGTVQSSITGASASRMAHIHFQAHEQNDDMCEIIDYRHG